LRDELQKGLHRPDYSLGLRHIQKNGNASTHASDSGEPDR
jgi:hypothetical protein